MNAGDIKKETSTEDIDLLLLAERSILFFRNHRWIFIIAIVLGLGTGYYFYRSIPKTYKSRMVVHSFLLSNPEEIQIVKNWNELLNKKEYEVLKKSLNCSENVLQKVKQIKAEEIQQIFSQANPNGFTIDAIVTDNLVLDELQKGIVYGFENIDYIKRRLDTKKASLSELIQKTNSEITQLDSTKKMVTDIIEGKGKIASPLIIDVSGANRQLVEMNEKLTGLKEGLAFTNAIQVLQNFEKFSQPVGPHLIPWLIMGLIAFLSLAWVLALFSSIREGLAGRKKERQKNAAIS